MIKALKIIELWINNATSRKLSDHVRNFWVARDILEKKIDVPDYHRNSCINFIEESIRESDEKTILLESLRGAT